MESIFLICYGNSEENVNITFSKKIIGASNGAKLAEQQLIYLIVKRDGKWTVVGKGNISSETEDNPFPKPNRFKTYKVDNLIECKPFAISDICRKELGDSYGLVLRSPRPISVKGFIEFLDKNFVQL